MYKWIERIKTIYYAKVITLMLQEFLTLERSPNRALFFKIFREIYILTITITIKLAAKSFLKSSNKDTMKKNKKNVQR